MSVFVPGYTTASGKVVRAYTRKKKSIRKATSRAKKGTRRVLTAKQIRFLKATETKRLAAARRKKR